MVNYPLNIESTTDAKSGIQNEWSSTAGSFGPIGLSIPREFDGPNTQMSPEDLFAMSLVNCFTATFKVVAEKANLSFGDLKGRAVVAIDHSPEHRGEVLVTSVHFKFTLSGVEESEKAERLLEQTSRQCILINSILAQTEFEFEVLGRELKS